VKIVLHVLCFGFVNIFVLKRENKREKEKVMSNKASFSCVLAVS
jgi:hypothetical protein